MPPFVSSSHGADDGCELMGWLRILEVGAKPHQGAVLTQSGGCFLIVGILLLLLIFWTLTSLVSFWTKSLLVWTALPCNLPHHSCANRIAANVGIPPVLCLGVHSFWGQKYWRGLLTTYDFWIIAGSCRKNIIDTCPMTKSCCSVKPFSHSPVLHYFLY